MDEANITIGGGGRNATFGASNVQIHFDFDDFAKGEELPNGDLWAAFREMGEKSWEVAGGMRGMSSQAEQILKAMRRIEDAYPLDEGEKLVARVLGHEYVASGVDVRCSCGLTVSGAKEFYRHAREAIEEAEAELP